MDALCHILLSPTSTTHAPMHNCATPFVTHAPPHSQCLPFNTNCIYSIFTHFAVNKCPQGFKHPAIRGLWAIHCVFDCTQLLTVFDQRGVPSIRLHPAVTLHCQKQHTAAIVHQINEAIDSATCMLKINLSVKINSNLWWVLTMWYSPNEGVQGMDHLLGILHNVTPVLIVRNSIMVD